MYKFKTYLKLFGIIAVAFGISIILNREVFLANTPRIKQNLGKYFLAQSSDLINILNIKNLVKKEIGFETQTKIAIQMQKGKEELNKLPMQSIAKGVSARSNDTHVEVVFDSNKIEWVEYTYIINGKKIKIRIPKGVDLPSEQEVELLHIETK